jgi:predicted transcriptional regulator
VFRVGSKRSRIEIYLDVLQAIRKGIFKPTRIMYRTNLSWKPLMEVLNAMIEQDLIASEDIHNHVIYKITEKGMDVLKYFNKAMELIEIKSPQKLRDLKIRLL